MRKSVVSLPPSRRYRQLAPPLITTLLLSLLLYRWSGALQLPTLAANLNAPLATCLTLATTADIPAPNKLITFDDLAVNTIIANSYKPAFGVAFENSDLKSSKVITFTDGIITTNVATSVITPSITNDDRRLLITFDNPQTHVGLLVGNGEPATPAQGGTTATLIAYNAQGGEICRVAKGPISTTTLSPFIGLRDPFGAIRAIAVDYGASEKAVVIDDLRFTYDAQAITPTATNTATPTPTRTPTPTPTPTRTPFSFAIPTPAPYLDLPLQEKELPFFVNDLAIWGVEVTQGIQCYDTSQGLTNCPNNSLPLAAGKKTTVRVYPRYIGHVQDAEVPVEVRVVVCADGADGMSQECYGQFATGVATTKFQRERVDLSAEFTFYAETFGPKAMPVFVSATIDPKNKHKEQDETNNNFPSGQPHFTVNFYDTLPMTIIGKRVRYKENGKEYKAQGASVAGDAAQWLQRVLPVRDGSLHYELASGYIDIAAPFLPKDFLDEDPAPDRLQAIEYQISIDEVLNSIDGLRYYYGWIPDFAYSGKGLASTVAPFTGMGTDLGSLAAPNDATYATKVFAHELIHVWQLGHIDLADSCGAYEGPDSGYYADFVPPYQNSTIQELWFSPYAHTVRNPFDTHDIMSYCGVAGRNGIRYARLSPFTWNYVLNRFKPKSQQVQATAASAAVTTGHFQRSNSEQVLAVSVAITNPHHGIAGAFNNLVRLDANRVLPPALPQGDYAVQLRMGNTPVYTQSFGVSFVPHTHTITSTLTAALAPIGPAHDGERRRTHSNFVIPWVDGADSVVLLHQQQILDQRSISKHSPVITITYPLTPQNWLADSQQVITWHGSDEDGDALTYTLQFNRDGSFWESVAVGITQSRYRIDVADYAGGPATRFRVLASDGLFSTLSEPSAPITMPDHLPTITISEPLSGTVRPPGASVVFSAHAFDWEDGLINDNAAYQWVSDKGGALGQGRDFFVNGMNTGWHTITLTVVDQAGQQVTQQTRLFVGSQLFLPLVRR